ncbi:MAG: hypothetical protein QNJ37_18640 [Crocosphaera sp.]|nr:hypothetical protein [Crocosphaera sp.]
MLNSKNYLKMSTNLFIFLASGLVFVLLSFSSYSQPCPSETDVSELTSYSWRGTHCEGIRKGEVAQTRSSPFRLISLSTGRIPKDNNNKIELTVFGSNPEQLKLKIESFRPKYEFGHFTSSNFKNSPYRFSISTNILKQAKVPPESLRFLAWEGVNSNDIKYFPVIHHNYSSTTYEIIWLTEHKADIDRFEIRSTSNQLVYSCVNNVTSYRANNEVICRWNAKKTPAGNYTIEINGKQFPYKRPDQPIERKIPFFHDPQWLKK